MAEELENRRQCSISFVRRFLLGLVLGQRQLVLLVVFVDEQVVVQLQSLKIDLMVVGDVELVFFEVDVSQNQGFHHQQVEQLVIV